jgi:hypothetical protein
MISSRFWLYLGLGLLLSVSFLGLTPRRALAHTRIEVGPYVLLLGWVEEPVIVGERNALVLGVTKADEPVLGLEGTLELTVLYAGRTFIGNLTPTGTAGIYEANIYPTVRGQYAVQLTGNIEDLAIDETIEPEEVLAANVLQFPEIQSDPTVLQERVSSLEGQLQTAYILAVVGVVLGLVGVLIGGFSLFRRSR